VARPWLAEAAVTAVAVNRLTRRGRPRAAATVVAAWAGAGLGTRSVSSRRPRAGVGLGRIAPPQFAWSWSPGRAPLFKNTCHGSFCTKVLGKPACPAVCPAVWAAGQRPPRSPTPRDRGMLITRPRRDAGSYRWARPARGASRVTRRPDPPRRRQTRTGRRSTSPMIEAR
jgi:hypothetical protein